MKTKKYLFLLILLTSFRIVSGVPVFSQGEEDQTEYIQNLNERIQYLQEILRETKKTLMNKDKELNERERQYEERVRRMKEMIEGNQKTIHDMAELLKELNNKYIRIREKNVEQRKQLRAYEMVKDASEYLLAENPKLTESISPQEKRQQSVYGSSTLHGLEGVSPAVILESPERKELGLAEQSLRTLVEGTLSKAGIRILRLGYDGIHRPDPNIARLIVTVETASDKTGDEPIYAYRISSQLLQSVQLARNRFIETVAPSWSTTSRTRLYVAEVDSTGVGEDIVILMNRQMNEFIKDYLAANPKPGPPPTEQTREDIGPPPREIVVEPLESWSTAEGWGSDLYRYTRNAWTNTIDGHLEFIVEDANSLHVWKRYGLSVSIADYPIAVFTYRARNVAPGWYTIWMDDGAGPWGGCVIFRPGQLIVDGKKHEIRADLRKVREVHKHSIKKLDEKGTVKGMTLGVRAGSKTPAVLEFIDLRFLPEK